MDWSNEAYVRLYVRNTTTWRRLGFEGQTMLMHMLRVVDRAGVLDIEDMSPGEAASLHTGAPTEFAGLGMSKLLELKALIHDGTRLVFPNFIDAQEATKSDRQRQKESREKRAVTKRDDSSQPVTEASQIVTESHVRSQVVTSGHSLLCSADLNSQQSGEKQHLLRIGFTQRLETEASTHPNQKALGQAIQQLVPWVTATAPLRKLSEAELITRLLNGFFANENARTKGFPPAFLAQNPTEYLDTKPQLRAAARVPDGIPPIKHYGPREETG